MPSLAAPATRFWNNRPSLLTEALKRGGQNPHPICAFIIPPRWRTRIQRYLLLTLAGLSATIHAATPSKSPLAIQSSGSQQTHLSITPAPDFALHSTRGETVKLSYFKGKVVLVNFWASWCPPCRAEMPVLDSLAQTHKAAGLVVLGLNVDVDDEARDEYLTEHPVSFLILDDSKWSTAKLYIAPSQPVTFFVDRDGNLAHVHQGYKPGDDLVYAAKVKELLAK